MATLYPKKSKIGPLFNFRSLATSKGTIGDAAYLIHEVAEVEELQRIQRETGFDFMGKNIDQTRYKQYKRWNVDFTTLGIVELTSLYL